MGLTISNWGNVSTRLGNPQQGIASDDWAALGKGLGGLQKWSQQQKAADMMEGKANVQDRIKAIDAEIAELEAKLNEFQEQEDAARRGAFAAEGMAGYRPNQALAVGPAPENVTSIYGEQYLATPTQNRSFNMDAVRAMEKEQADYEKQKAMQGAAYANNMAKYRWGR